MKLVHRTFAMPDVHHTASNDHLGSTSSKQMTCKASHCKCIQLILTLLMDIIMSIQPVIHPSKHFVLYVFSWRCVRGLTSPATANEPMIDALFYFVFVLLYVGFMYNK